MGGKTLSGRLFWLSSLWALVSIALIAFLITNEFRNSTERRLTELLTANLYNLMGTVEPDSNGKLNGLPDLRDARFLNFQSGYYWSVNEISNPQNKLSSLSLVDETISAPKNLPFDSNFQRNFSTLDSSGNKLSGVEAQVFLGEGDNLYRFLITANKSDMENEISAFVRQLLILLTLFAVGFVLVTYFLVRLGLSPLRKISDGLSDIREGRAQRLEGDFPTEIQPLVEETNSLIKSNNTVIERARTQVGNLAHSLKTPLAVLKNEAKNASPQVKSVITQQTTQMHNHVKAYLDRASIAARAGSVTSRTEITPAIERMLRVMKKLNSTINFTLDVKNDDLIFAGEQQDFEEILGNLLENAGKFAKGKVQLVVSLEDANHIKIAIEDDGPGLEAHQLEEVLTRGVRLDESKPGSGLGLSIVKDISDEYDGEIKLSSSNMGGLMATLILPGSKS